MDFNFVVLTVEYSFDSTNSDIHDIHDVIFDAETPEKDWMFATNLEFKQN